MGCVGRQPSLLNVFGIKIYLKHLCFVLLYTAEDFFLKNEKNIYNYNSTKPLYRSLPAPTFVSNRNFTPRFSAVFFSFT